MKQEDRSLKPAWADNPLNLILREKQNKTITKKKLAEWFK
jgi:hypothetical protein